MEPEKSTAPVILTPCNRVSNLPMSFVKVDKTSFLEGYECQIEINMSALIRHGHEGDGIFRMAIELRAKKQIDGIALRFETSWSKIAIAHPFAVINTRQVKNIDI